MEGKCGINCLTCECYQATIKNDDRMRMNVAIKWSKLFKRTVLPREINCLGCHQADVQFDNCKTCVIRQQELDEKLKISV